MICVWLETIHCRHHHQQQQQPCFSILISSEISWKMDGSNIDWYGISAAIASLSLCCILNHSSVWRRTIYSRLFLFYCTCWSSQCPLSSWKVVSFFSVWQLHKALRTQRAQRLTGSLWVKAVKHVSNCIKLVVFAVYNLQTLWKSNYCLYWWLGVFCWT